MKNTRMHLFTIAIPLLALLLTFNTAAAQITVNAVPSAVPSNIIAFVPINIYNQMPSSTPNGFQQILEVNSTVFSAYEAANLDNVGFFYSNGTYVSSWLRSGSSSSLSVYWLKLNPQIPSNGFISIFMGFASRSTALSVPNDTSGAAQPSVPNATMPFSVYGHLSSTLFNSSDISTTLASNSIVVGQSETITASVTGGISPYSYQWKLNGANVGTNSNTFLFNGNLTTLAGSPDNVTVVVHDALGTAAQNSTRIRVAMAPLITLTPNRTVLDSGQSITFNIMITGGIGPFNVELYNITGSRRQAANVTIHAPGGSGTVTFPVSYINTTAPNSILSLSFNAFATDLGSASTGLFSSLPSTIMVHTSPNVSIMDPVLERAAAAAAEAAARTTGDPTLTISSSPSNGGITSPTSGTYNISGTATMLTIIASPNPGYMFTGWTGTGPGSYTGSNPFETVPINSNITEVANFQQTTYTLTITNNGCTSVSGSGTFNALSSQQFSATVPAGYSFSWSGTGSGSYTGTNNPATVTMNGNIAETATCSVNLEQLIMTASPASEGTVAPSSNSYPYNTIVTISETPNAGYQFVTWTGAGGPGSYTGTSATAQVTMSSNIIEVALFQRLTYSLAIVNNGCTTTSGAGTFNALSSQQVSATVPSGYSLAWAGTGSGSYSGTSNPATVTMDSNITETATCMANPEQLTMSANPSSGGTVLPGNTVYSFGNTVTISETPSAGYTFTGWTGTGSGSYTGTSTSTQLTMNSNIIEVANFQIATYTLTITNNGCTSVSGAGTYSSGASEQVSATVQTGYTLSWSGSGTGSYTGSSNPATVTMNGNIVETATCSATTEQLTMSASPANAGTFTPGSQTYPYGTGVTLSETPSYGYLFTGWSGSGTGSYTGTSASPTITMDGSITEIADFQTAYTLTTINDGCTSVSASGTYVSGSSVPISVTVPTGYTFTGWSGTGTGSYTGTSSSVTVTMNADILEVATCTESAEQLTMSTSPSNSGTVSPGTQTYLYSSVVQISETPSTGYTFTGWSGSGTGSYTGTSTSPTITMDGPITEVANFQQVTYTISITNNGCTSVSGAGTYSSGASEQVSAVVPTGYTLSWSGSGTGSYTGSSNPATVTMNGNIVETATCSATTEQLTMSASPSGDGTVSPGSGSYTYGTTVTLSETPASGYTFTGWSGSGTGSYTGTSSSPTITMGGPITETANFNAVTTYTVTIEQNPSGASGSWEACIDYYLPGGTGSQWQEQCIGSQKSGWGVADGQSSLSFSVPSGSTIVALNTAQATGTTSYSFSSWSGSYSTSNPTTGTVGVGPTGAGSLDIGVTGALTFVANYQITYTLTESTSPDGTGGVGTSNPTVDGTSYPCYSGCTTSASGLTSGESITLSEAPDSGYQFVEWVGTGTGSYTGTASAPTITMDGNINEVADFEAIPTYPVTIQESPSGASSYWNACFEYVQSNGQTSSPVCAGNGVSSATAYVPEGHDVTYICASQETADEYSFSNWTVSDSGVVNPTACNTGLSIAINSAITWTANFNKLYSVTILESPSAAASSWGACFDYYLPSGAEQPQVCAGPGYASSTTVYIPSGSVMNYLCTANWEGDPTYAFSQFVNQGDAGAYSIDGSSCSDVVVYINQDYTETAQYTNTGAGSGGGGASGGGGGSDGGGGDGGDGGG